MGEGGIKGCGIGGLLEVLKAKDWGSVIAGRMSDPVTPVVWWNLGCQDTG